MSALGRKLTLHFNSGKPSDNVGRPSAAAILYDALIGVCCGPLGNFWGPCVQSIMLVVVNCSCVARRALVMNGPIASACAAVRPGTWATDAACLSRRPRSP